MDIVFENVLTGHAAAIYSIKKISGSELIYTGSADGMLALWDLNAGVSLPFSIKVGYPVFSIELWPEKQILFIGQSEGHIHIIDLNSRKEIRNLHYSRKGIFKIKLVERLKLVLALGGEGNLAVIDGDGFDLKIDIPLSEQKLRCIELSNNEGHLIIGGSDGFIRVLDTSYFNEWSAILAHEGGVYALAWLSDSLLVSGGRDGHLRFWNFNGSELIQVNSIPAHNYAIYDISVSHDRKYFATASRDKTVKVWDVADLINPIRLSRTGLCGHTHSVNTVLWMSEINKIISAGDDKQLIVWQIS